MGSKSKSKNTQKDNSVNMAQLQKDNPKQEFDDVYGNSQTMMGDMMGGIMDPFMELIARGEDTMAQNPMLQLIQQITGDKLGGGGGEQAPDPYEMRIKELMDNRGMTRDQAVANQASANGMGGDIDENGAVTNKEWQAMLGMDYNGDGNVSKEDEARWMQENPDHVVAGGTKYKGLPGENGLFAGQEAPQQAQQGQQQQAPQQPMGQPQAGVMPAPPQPQQQPQQQQGMQAQQGQQQMGQQQMAQQQGGGMSQQATNFQLPPQAQAALAKWNQQGRS